MLNSLYGLQFTNDGTIRPIFTFGIMSKGEDTTLYITVPEEYETIFKKKYAAVDSYIQFEEIDDPLLEFAEAGDFIEGYEMKLIDDNPEKTLKGISGGDSFTRFMGNMLNAMNNIDNKDISIYEVAIQPFNDKKKMNLISKGLTTTAKLGIEGIRWGLNNLIINDNIEKENKANKELKKSEINSRFENLLKFNTNIRVISTSIDHISALNNIKGMAAVFSDLSSSNSLIPINIKKEDIINRKINHNNKLSTSEIVQFLHLPDRTVNTDNMGVSNCKKIYDRDIPSDGVFFGLTGPNKDIPACFPMVPVSIETFKQCYADIHKLVDNFSKPRLFLGQQGTGKSEEIINYIIACIRLGIGVIVVDPKNDTQQRLIESIPVEFLPKLDYINFGDTVYPPGMNLFRKRSIADDPTENSLIVTSFISLMKKEYTKNWGFHIQRILQNTAEAILLMQISTMHEFELMLVDRKYREFVIDTMKLMLNDTDKKGKSHIKKLVRFWDIFNNRKDEIIAREIEPVMNQIGPFLSNRVIKAIVSQNNSFDFRKAADSGRIVVINLPEGVLGENTRLLASMINKAIWIDIQSRASIDISERYPVAWIIDEAHEIVDDEFISVLTKARAYRLGLTLVTQGLTNFGMRKLDEIKTLIQTNCKNKVVFRVGYQDGKEIGEEFAPLTSVDVQNCPDYHFYAKILLPDGTVSNPFFAQAPMPAKKIRNFDNFISSHRSGMFTVDQIEDELEERMDHIDVMRALTTM